MLFVENPGLFDTFIAKYFSGTENRASSGFPGAPLF
jgi:hypothetical protein